MNSDAAGVDATYSLIHATMPLWAVKAQILYYISNDNHA
jgi:hypothetical protein